MLYVADNAHSVQLNGTPRGVHQRDRSRGIRLGPSRAVASEETRGWPTWPAII